VKRAVHSCQQFLERRTRLFLGEQRGHLRLKELLAFQIRDEPIDAAGDVPDMKTHRAETVRRGPDLLRREPAGAFCGVFARLLERIQDWRDERVYTGNRASHGSGRVSIDAVFVAVPRRRPMSRI